MPQTDIKDAKRKMQAWLREHQGKSGGWGEREGATANVLNTAEALVAVVASGMEPAQQWIQEGADYLIKHRHNFDSPDYGAWARDIPAGDSIRYVPDILRTSLAVRALFKVAKPDHTVVREGIAWLLSMQKGTDQKSGWPYRRGLDSDIVPTCFVLLALIEAHRAGQSACEEPIRSGLGYLIGQQDKINGCFGPTHPMVGVRTIYAVLALQATGGNGLPTYPEQKERAIKWILMNPVQARSVVEENAAIAPDREGNYGFLFMPKLLTTRLEGLPLEAKQALLLDFNEDFDDSSGGFYGRRIFSWSTAAALQALSATDLKYLPEPEKVYSGPKVGFPVLLFGVVLILAIVVLSWKELYGPLATVSFLGVMLCVLVAYGSIREQTFQQLFVSVLKVGRTDKKA